MLIRLVRLALLLALLVAATSCTQTYGPIAIETYDPCSPTAIDSVPSVLAAYLATVESVHGAEVVAPLIEPARGASADPEVEHRRAADALDSLVCGRLAPFVVAAGIDDADWLDALPVGELSPAETYAAALSAQRLASALRAGLPLDDAPWIADYDAITAQQHAAIHAIVGRPATWYASVAVFQATSDLALVAGFAAGQEAGTADAALDANADTFAQVRANAIAEAQTLIAMDVSH